MPADALIFRDVDERTWDVLRIHVAQLAAYEAQGWHLLVSAESVREDDVRETYEADVQRFDNRPRIG